jgi:hypothetical protein
MVGCVCYVRLTMVLVMKLDGTMFHITSYAIIRQLLEILKKEIHVQKGRKGVKVKNNEINRSC